MQLAKHVHEANKVIHKYKNPSREMFDDYKGFMLEEYDGDNFCPDCGCLHGGESPERGLPSAAWLSLCPALAFGRMQLAAAEQPMLAAIMGPDK